MPVFFTFLNTRIWWGAYNQAVARGITRPICMPMVVTTTNLMFRKIFEFYGLTNFMLKWFGVVLKKVMVIFISGIFT